MPVYLLMTMSVFIGEFTLTLWGHRRPPGLKLHFILRRIKIMIYKLDGLKFWDEFREAFYPKGGLEQLTVDNLNLLLYWIENDINTKGLEYFSGFEGLAYLLG